MFKYASRIIKNFSLIRPLYESSITIRYCSGQCGTIEKKGLCLGIYDYDPQNDEPVLTKSAQKYDKQVSGKIIEMIKRSGKKFKLGKGLLLNNVDKDFYAVAVVGVGPQDAGENEMESVDEAKENVRFATGAGVQLLKQQAIDRVSVDCMDHPEQAAEGAVLSAYRYQELKMKEHQQTIAKIEPYDCPDGEAFERGVCKAECQNWARKLCEMPANVLTPLGFAQETVDQLCPCGIKVQVHDKDWIEARKFTAFLHAARGSCEPPILLEVTYNGGGAGGGEGKPIVFVGKGITFDSGGLCVKGAYGMDIFRADMTGAAAIVAAIGAASKLRIPINIEAVILLCENMISSMAMRPGDIITAMNGKTIRIADTDKEGRLLLADGLVYAQKAFKPRVLIDVASMTIAIRSLFGSSAAGVFTNSKALWHEVEKAGTISGDRVWRLPLWDFFQSRVKNYRHVDMSNRGKGTGNPCLAAGFLKEFIDCVDWIHFDTTSVGYSHDHKYFPYITKGTMTGRPTRTLVQLLYQLSQQTGEATSSTS